MATVDDLVSSELLELYDLPEWETRLSVRPVWIALELWDWVDSCDALHDLRCGAARRTRFEHLEQTLCDLRCSKHIPAGDLRRMMPNNQGIWSVHSVGLRVYGWCPRPHAFVAVAAALEEDTKDKSRNLNDRKRDYVRSFITAHKVQSTVLLGDHSAVFPQNT